MIMMQISRVGLCLWYLLLRQDFLMRIFWCIFAKLLKPGVQNIEFENKSTRKGYILIFLLKEKTYISKVTYIFGCLCRTGSNGQLFWTSYYCLAWSRKYQKTYGLRIKISRRICGAELPTRSTMRSCSNIHVPLIWKGVISLYCYCFGSFLI